MVFKKKRKRKSGGDIGEHKFCPVCGHKLETHDTYCTRCGYSFAERKKKKKKSIKLLNLIIAIIILLIAYLAINYFTTGSLLPEFLSNFTDGSTPPSPSG